MYPKGLFKVQVGNPLKSECILLLMLTHFTSFNLITGSVLLDLEETDLSNIFHRIVDNLITSDQIAEEHQGDVLRSLLLKHK